MLNLFSYSNTNSFKNKFFRKCKCSFCPESQTRWLKQYFTGIFLIFTNQYSYKQLKIILMTPLSRIIHQVAKIIICWNIFLIRTLSLSKTFSFANPKIPLPRMTNQIAKTVLYSNFFYIYKSIVI